MKFLVATEFLDLRRGCNITVPVYTDSLNAANLIADLMRHFKSGPAAEQVIIAYSGASDQHAHLRLQNVFSPVEVSR